VISPALFKQLLNENRFFSLADDKRATFDHFINLFTRAEVPPYFRQARLSDLDDTLIKQFH
jgi:hypothetical protein